MMGAMPFAYYSEQRSRLVEERRRLENAKRKSMSNYQFGETKRIGKVIERLDTYIESLEQAYCRK